MHQLLGGGPPDITVRSPLPRKGRLRYVLASREAGQQAELLHRTAGRIRVDEPGALTLNYVVTGEVLLYLDPRSLRSWVLEVDVLEVSA
ncbi:hypothetical protein [Rathayibacter sp. AY1B5]|uniref:hypothetical protein n=1 Tax=Rathayibacter sp. AY1B5 TaxID=2080530 RepID=UPI0011B0DAFA|nr:hypothetical protein [Rathayibacter sp. AY1B5]